MILNHNLIMKEFLINISKELKSLSLSLNKTSILINKPWTLVDDDNEIQKLIFKKNKDLVLSKNGVVQMGRWDYFPEAKSILIDRKYDTILCNEVFIDNGILILKIDGTNDTYFTLSNENYIPDLNPVRYLKELKSKKLNIKEFLLKDNNVLEVHLSKNQNKPSVGDKVVIQGVKTVDGLFKILESDKYLEIRRNTFSHIFVGKKYNDINSQEFQIIQRSDNDFQLRDYVFKNDRISKDDEIILSQTKKIILHNGIIVRVKWKLFNLWWI